MAHPFAKNAKWWGSRWTHKSKPHPVARNAKWWGSPASKGGGQECPPHTSKATGILIAMKHILNWILSALAVWLVARLVPGFHVSGPIAALIAALAIGFINATLGLFLKLVTFPLTVITLGIFWLLINAAMIELASAIVPGFHVDSFGAAFWGAIVLSIVNMLFRWLAGTGKSSYDRS
jgi:putative membrane protein